MQSRLFIFLKIIISLNICLNAFAQDTERDFVKKFKLLKKENYYLPTQKTNPVLSRINLLNEPAKIYLINNDILKGKKLLLFYIQSNDICHACGIELWLYNQSKKPSVVQLAKDTGNSGEPPSLLETIVKNNHIYFLFKSTFEGQGIAESSLEIIQYRQEIPMAKRVYFSFLSDTSYEGHTPYCKGWSTKYEISNDNIAFYKNGFNCKFSLEPNKCRNSTKVQKKDFYEFEKDE